MLDFRLYNAAVYRFAQETSWTNPFPCIVLNVAGLRWRRYPDGREERPRGPYLELVAAGRTSSYRFGPERENWVVQLITDDIRQADDPAHCELHSHGSRVRVPSRLPLSAARCRHWQRHCARLVADGRSPEPLRQLRMRATVCELLAAFVDAAEPESGDTPCERFRRAIDADEAFARTLGSLSREQGYSSDHLRRCFVERFGLTPKQYREQRRIALAAELVANGTESLQAISERLGYQHCSHFCASYKQHFGTTPGTDMRRLRVP